VEPTRSPAKWMQAVGRRAWHLGSAAFQRRVLGRRFLKKRIHGYHMMIDARDPGIGSQLLRIGKREEEQRIIVERELREGMIAFDLGANMGYYTLMMARQVGSEGFVYAVEPHPRNFALLRRNVDLNRLGSRTELEEVAIAEEDGRRALHVTEQSNWHSFHDPRRDAPAPWSARYERHIVSSLEVETRTLSGYLRNRRPIDFLRMDLEGYEVDILRAIAAEGEGMSNRLHVLFETHPEFYSAARNDIRPVLEDLCFRQGYCLKYLVSDFHFGSRRHRDIEPGAETFRRLGYAGRNITYQSRWRAIFTGVKTEHAIDLIATREQVHAAFLAPVAYSRRPTC
jgi:FkbM family methyltransferase